MSEESESNAAIVRSVFWIAPTGWIESANDSLARVPVMPVELMEIGSAFLENLHSVIRTLSIPFTYTYSEVHSLHWQRFSLAAKIRMLKVDDEPDPETSAIKAANENFKAFVEGEGGRTMVDDVLIRLRRLAEAPESLAAARELTNQGIVLVWSAIEVLARDCFVYLLNHRPVMSERLLSDSSNRKRFAVDRIDWSVLAMNSYNLSGSLGTLLISKADLTNVQSMRDTFGALFPQARDLSEKLRDERLWMLCQKRNLIVHRRGVVDQQYLDCTGDAIALGNTITISPREIEDQLNNTSQLGILILTEIASAVST